MDTEFNTCLYFSTNNLSKVLSGMADQQFKAIGLAPSYAFLLMGVNESPGIQPSELGSLLGLKPSTITRLIEKMEHQGYLERKSEGRATHVFPTPKCENKDSEIKGAWDDLREGYKGILGERYTEVLTEMSVKAIDQLDDEL